MLEAIKTYGYHEITHPGQTHEEIEVEPWAYKWKPQSRLALQLAQVLDRKSGL